MPASTIKNLVFASVQNDLPIKNRMLRFFRVVSASFSFFWVLPALLFDILPKTPNSLSHLWFADSKSSAIVGLIKVKEVVDVTLGGQFRVQVKL